MALLSVEAPDLLVIFTEEQPKSVVRLQLGFFRSRKPGPSKVSTGDEQASCLRNLEIAQLRFDYPQTLVFVHAVAEIISHLSGPSPTY